MVNPTTNQLVDWVDAISRRGINLTTWEIEFIESMQAKIDRYGPRVRFTDNEAESIERVYSERVP